jgi:HK97 family phage major capsid protein
VSWVAEGSAPSQSSQTLDSVAMIPYTVTAFTQASRPFLADQPNGVAIAIDDLTRGLSSEIDRVAFEGTGSSNQPTGIRASSGIQTLAIGANGGAPTFAHLVEMERLLGVANADIGRLGFATSPNARAKLRLTERAAGSGLVWGDDNLVLGYPAAATSNIPQTLTKGTAVGTCSAMILGDFEDLLIPTFGALDLIVDRFTQATGAVIRIIALLSIDIKLAQPSSFVVCNDAITS